MNITPAPLPMGAVLCYIDPKSKLAYFTTQELSKQTGDDWNKMIVPPHGDVRAITA
jgi:hypothetical protein